MSDSADDFETRLAVLEREVAQLREQVAHTQGLNALRETQLEQGQKIDKLDREMHEMREGFSTVATGMAQITALLTNIAGPERDGS